MLKWFSTALLLVVLIWHGMPVQSAYACSAGDDFNPIASSDVVVMGVITDWEKVTSPAGPPTFQPIRLTIAVERTLKGPYSSTIHAFDVASLINDAQGPISGRWAGSSGACGAFNSDPQGKYVVLGLHRNDDGTLGTSILRTFFVGDRTEFASAEYERVREFLGSFGLIVPPSTGSGGLAHEPVARGGSWATQVIVLLSLLAATTTGLVLWYRRVNGR